MLGNKEKAKDAFEQALKKDKNFTPTLSYYGYYTGIQSGLDNFEKGKTLLEESISIDPSRAVAYYYLGLLWSEKEDFVKAKYYIDIAVAIEPENRIYQDVQKDLQYIFADAKVK